MKLYWFLILFSFSLSAWCIPLEDLEEEQVFLLKNEAPDAVSLSPNILEKKSSSYFNQKNTRSDETLLNQQLIPQTSLKKEIVGGSAAKEKVVGQESEFYLFDQEEQDAQKPGLEIYQSLAPMLTPEMKKDAKKVWAETTDFREAIDFSTKDSESKELTLQQSSKEMALFEGKTLEELTNKNLPPGIDDKKEPDKAMVRELFDGIYDLLKNALLIIVGVLIAGKIITFIVKKVLAGSEKRKKRKAKRHSKRRRKKRRQTFA